MHRDGVRLTTFPGVWLKDELCKQRIAASSSAGGGSQVCNVCCWMLALKKVIHGSAWECLLQMADVMLLFHFVREAW